MPHPAYRVLELAFDGPAEPIPADRTPFEAVFTGPGGDIAVPGFWDGGSRYLVRFTPEVEGAWTWRTSSAEPTLDAHSGAFEVAGAEGHGPVRPAATFHFAHADGTPFFPVGATVYNWIHQPDALYEETLADIAANGFDKLRFLVFPQAGDHVAHFPDLLPFEKDAAGRWDVARPVPEFFQRLDRAVQELGAVGIQADVLVYTSYDGGRFGLDALTEEEDAVYLRYLVARLGAYPNVWWSLCNEYDILDRPMARWDRAGTLLAEIDVHRHPRSIHNWMQLHDYNQPWITHASIQQGTAVADFGRAGTYRDAYRKPIVMDEIKYEGDAAERWGHLSGRELVHRFWIATASGVYASHGESFLLDDDSYHIVEGGTLRGESPVRLAFLRRFLEGLGVPGLDPIDKWDDPDSIVGVPGALYLRYFGTEAPTSWRFRLPQSSLDRVLAVGDRYRVSIVDTWNMTVTPIDRVFTLTEVAKNDGWDRASAPLDLPEGEAVAVMIERTGR